MSLLKFVALRLRICLGDQMLNTLVSNGTTTNGGLEKGGRVHVHPEGSAGEGRAGGEGHGPPVRAIRLTLLSCQVAS